MKLHTPCLLALCSSLLIALTGCSDPAKNVHKATAGAAQDGTLDAASGKVFVIRPESKISFVGSKVTGKHDGGFTNFSGNINVADGRIVGQPTVTIDMNSVWSDNNRLTGHLKSADFFEVETYPTSTFTVTAIEPAGSQHRVTGNLNLHGVSKSISFPADISTTDGSLTLKAEFAINRKDFNILYSGRADDLIRDDVVLKLDIVAAPEG